MRLDTHRGAVSASATEYDVRAAVASLVDDGAFIVLIDDDTTAGTTAGWYAQAAGTVAEGFVLERRDGDAASHRRADRRVSAAELAAALVAYLRGDVARDGDVGWYRVRVDGDGPAA